MALDPGIALQVRPPQVNVDIPSPLDAAGRALTMQGLMQQTQLRNLQMQEEQRNLQEEQSLRDLFAPGKPEPTLAALISVGGKKGADLSKSVLDQKTAQLTQHKSVLDAAQKDAETVDRILNSATDNTSKLGAIAKLVELGTITSQQGAQYAAMDYSSPEFQTAKKRATDESLNYLNRLDAAQKNLAIEYAKNEEERKRLGFEAELPGKQAASSAAQWELVAQTAPKNQTDWTIWRDRAPAEIRPFIPPMYSPAAWMDIQTKGQKPAAGTTYPLAPDVLQQKEDIQAASVSAPIAAQKALYQPIIDQANKDPEYYRNLPDATKDKIAPYITNPQSFKAGVKPTAAQETVANYAARIKQAEPIFDTIRQSVGEQTWNDIGAMPEILKTEKGKLFQQAERNFINSVLRRESGAVISASEFADARRQYIPQPGDSEAVLDQKRKNRLVVQQSLINAAGPAYVDPDELLRKAGAGGGPGAQDSTALPPGWTPAMKSSGPKDEPKQVWVGPSGNISTRPPKMYQGHVYAFDGTQWVRQ